MVKDLVMITSQNKKERQEDYKVDKISYKNKKYYVTFNHYTSEIILSEEQIVEFRIIVGNTFSKQEFNKIKNAENIAYYYDKALHYIDFKPRTKLELVQYLQNLNVEEKNIDQIVKKLTNISYLDDERYAKSYVLECIRKAKGRNYIYQTLLSKGLKEETIQNYLEQYDITNEKNNALQMGKKLIPIIKNKPLKKQKIQLSNKLIQEGYSFDIINQVLSSIELIDESDVLLTKEYQKLQDKNIEKNQIIAKLLTKGFEYSAIRKIMEDSKYN